MFVPVCDIKYAKTVAVCYNNNYATIGTPLMFRGDKVVFRRPLVIVCNRYLLLTHYAMCCLAPRLSAMWAAGW